MQTMLIAAVLAAVFVVCFSTWGRTLLLRPLWMDEVHSWLLISDPDVSHALTALSHGADYNPPVYYLVARIFHSVVPLNEHNLRLLSAIFTLGTALGLTQVLARRMTWLAAVGSSLLICSQSLLILQSTEARFYALWLCLLTWFCLLLTTRVQFSAVAHSFGLAVLAALIAGTHYFGIISVGLVCSAYLVAQRFTKTSVVKAAIPLAASVVTVAACLPLLKGQKAALTTATWVKPTTTEAAIDYVGQFFPPRLILVACGIWLIGVLLQPRPQNQPASFQDPSDRPSTPTPPNHGNSDLYVFGSLLLMPLVLIVFSVTVQPALVNRYAIVGCLWLVPAVSVLFKTQEARKSGLVFVAGCLMFAFGVRHGSATWDFNLTRQRHLAERLNEIPAGDWVLFENRIDYWLAQHQSRKKTWFQFDFESAADDDFKNLRIVQRDVGRAIQPLYPGQFPMKSLQDCDSVDFYLVPYQDQQPQSVILSSGRPLIKINDSVYKVSVK